MTVKNWAESVLGVELKQKIDDWVDAGHKQITKACMDLARENNELRAIVRECSQYKERLPIELALKLRLAAKAEGKWPPEYSLEKK